MGLGLLSVAATSGDARACGGCFHGPTQSGSVITDHRMIFRVSPTETTLYDEIEYQGNPASFAWVLPIHGTVTVGLSSDIVFAALEASTKTTIQSPTLPACPSCSCADFGGTAGAAADAGASLDASDHGVSVTGQAVVGPYDTVQLHSTDPNALDAWLTANGYSIPADIQPIVAAYVNEGFDFLALRLAPGQGVQAMRPVRVTAAGAGLSLPLRMVAAGTGATVGITLWVVADGRYEPQNFKQFTIDPSELTWDWAADISDYTTVRAQKEAALGNAAWQIESSLELSPYQIENSILNHQADQDYDAVPASDAGGAGQTADEVRQADLSTLFPSSNQGSVRVTRMRSDLSHAALGTDLALQASQDQSAMSNNYRVTQSVNAPQCPAVPNPCPPCQGPGGTYDGGPAGTGPGGVKVSGASPGQESFGCAAAASSEDSRGAGTELAVAGIALVTFVGMRRRRSRK
ncbi:MAG TPA: DUF2330 domain-containing protein [Polyangiaceae bacterium]